MDKSMLKKLNHLLLKGATPLQSKLIERYGITEHHLIKGIPCPDCYGYPMFRSYKKWSCSKCSHFNATAQKRVILDYFLLHNNTITNKECRNLLQTESRKYIYITLNSMGLKRSGNTSARKYYAPHPDNFPQNSKVPNKTKSIFEH